LHVFLFKTGIAGEGPLHPQPEGRGIRDPLRSLVIKKEFLNQSFIFQLIYSPSERSIMACVKATISLISWYHHGIRFGCAYCLL